MPLLDSHGNSIGPEEIIDEHFQTSERQKIIAASDMDGTMFKNDLGTLVFLEKLSDPTFWDLNPDEFERILLPQKYRQLLTEGITQNVQGLNVQVCALAMALANDIRKLYTHIHGIVSGKMNNRKQQQSLIREFARKMMELDRIFVMIDSTLSQHLDGEILMRTRFFAGKNPRAITQLAKRVMQRSPTAVDRYIHLPIEESNREIAEQTVTEAIIREVHDGAESPFGRIDRLVKPVKDISMFIRHAVEEAGIPAIVATGNLKAIAKTAIDSSEYHFLEQQRFRRRKKQGENIPPLVVGTWLRSEKDGTLHPRVKGKPVLGDRKAYEVKKFAAERRKKLGIALGDSVTTDGPMLRAALQQEGIAIIVGPDVETIQKKFHTIIRTAGKMREGIYYSVEKE